MPKKMLSMAQVGVFFSRLREAAELAERRDSLASMAASAPGSSPSRKVAPASQRGARKARETPSASGLSGNQVDVLELLRRSEHGLYVADLAALLENCQRSEISYALKRLRLSGLARVADRRGAPRWVATTPETDPVKASPSAE